MDDRIRDMAVGVAKHVLLMESALTLALMPSTAHAANVGGSEQDSLNYVGEFVNGADSVTGSDAIAAATNVAATTDPPFPGFGNIAGAISNGILMFVPIVFVIKFAGRALLSILYSGDDGQDGTYMPRFFRSSVERKNNAKIEAGTAWYINMAKDFIRYFGIAVGSSVIVRVILGLIGLVVDAANATGMPTDASGFLGYFGM